MAAYCYKCNSCGKTAEVIKSMADSDKDEKCSACTNVMDRDLPAEHGGNRDTPGNWPMESYAAGGHPDDAKANEKIARDKGVPTHFSKDGDPIFTSRSHRKKFLQAHELIDRNAGYSD